MISVKEYDFKPFKGFILNILSCFVRVYKGFMNTNRMHFVLCLLFVLLHSTIYSQQNIPDQQSAASATSFAYPQSIFVDSPSGHIWVTDFDNHRVLRFDVSTLTAVEKSFGSTTPREFSLAQNFPNPFNPTTQISFSLKNTAHATLIVYNLLGQQMTVLFDEIATSNTIYSIAFDGTLLSSGMYLYVLRSSEGSEVKKMSLLK